MTVKTCNTCKQTLDISAFSHKSKRKKNIIVSCLKCNKERSAKERLSPERLISRIFYHQKESCKKRQMEMPKYTKPELKKWAFNQYNWPKLYETWKNSGYQKKLVPSIDRIDELKTYSFDNIRLTTWEDNDRMGSLNIRSGTGRGGKRCKAVAQYDLIGNLVKTYHSFAAAGRETGFSFKVIWKCAAGILQRAYGFTWKYYNEGEQ